jgi:hypothetical protein
MIEAPSFTFTVRSWINLSRLWIVFAVVLGACSPGAAGTYTPLNADKPLAQLPEGLTVSANPSTLSADFGVQLRALAQDALANGQAGQTPAAAYAARPAALTMVSAFFTLSAQGSAPPELFLSLIAPSGLDAGLLDLYAWNGQAWSFLPSQARGGQRVAAVTTLPQAVAAR